MHPSADTRRLSCFVPCFVLSPLIEHGRRRMEDYGMGGGRTRTLQLSQPT